jgi:hypothetical protein
MRGSIGECIASYPKGGITMSELTNQELTGLDQVIAGRKPLGDQLNNVNNLQSSHVTPSGNAGILQCENLELTGGEGLSLDELAKLRSESFT